MEYLQIILQLKTFLRNRAFPFYLVPYQGDIYKYSPSYSSPSLINDWYSSSFKRASSSSGDDISISTNQPLPNGYSLIVSGASSNSSLIRTTVPDTGAKISETALTDSIVPIDSSAVTSSSTCGFSTNTISPSNFWA